MNYKTKPKLVTLTAAQSSSSHIHWWLTRNGETFPQAHAAQITSYYLYSATDWMRSEVMAAGTIKVALFWDVTPCSLIVWEDLADSVLYTDDDYSTEMMQASKTYKSKQRILLYNILAILFVHCESSQSLSTNKCTHCNYSTTSMDDFRNLVCAK